MLAANVSSTSSSSPSSTSNDISGQDTDIDILQVQETVTVDSDGTVIFPCRDEQQQQQQQRRNNLIFTTNATATTTTTAGGGNISAASFSNELSQHELQQFSNAIDCQNFNTTANNSKNLLWWRENLNLDKSKLILIGFSKGCVVLNQVCIQISIFIFVVIRYKFLIIYSNYY